MGEVAVVLVVIFTLVFLISSITDRIRASIDSRSELSHTTGLQFLLVEFEHLDFFFEVLPIGSSTDRYKDLSPVVIPKTGSFNLFIFEPLPLLFPFSLPSDDATQQAAGSICGPFSRFDLSTHASTKLARI